MKRFHFHIKQFTFHSHKRAAVCKSKGDNNYSKKIFVFTFEFDNYVLIWIMVVFNLCALKYGYRVVFMNLLVIK